MHVNLIKTSVVIGVLSCLYGCGGSKIVKHPEPMAKQVNALAIATDENIKVSLDWIIVKNSPESWVKNGDWDEFIFRAQALSDQPLQITDIVVYDSLNFRLTHMNDRADLKAGSKQTSKRYKDAKLDVTPGAGTLQVVSGATGAVLGGAYLAGATAGGAGMMAGPAAAVGVAAAVTLMAPIFAAAGIVRGVHQHKVNLEVQQIASNYPLAISQSQASTIHAFYPFAPSPNKIEIHYLDATGKHVLNMDTKQALAGLHMVTSKPKAP